MCGRFVASRPVEDIAALLDVDDIEVPEELTTPRWNVAPTDGVLAVATRVRSDGPEPRRRLTDYRWGLVPSWAKDPHVGIRAFNARAESLTDRPAFRTALVKRRCLVPADAFYEWEKIALGGRVVRRQPWCFAAADGGLLAFAGLWEAWKAPANRDPEAALAGPGWHDHWLLSCTIITTTANALVEPLHDRMPVILPPEDWAVWLDPGRLDPRELNALLRPPPDGLLCSYPVSPAVNNTRSEGPELVAPLPARSAGGGQGGGDVHGEGDGDQPRLLPLR
ncbi:MAG TPA: SOS response-associated peptidase [Acidimicrobiales bacterium]|nr:SOS response-associated peptidase [Acidimicrobiales bacterium]